MRPNRHSIAGIRRFAARRLHGPRLIAAALPALLLLLLLPASRAAAAQPAPRSAVSAPIKVVVAVLPFRVHSARPLDYLENSLADLLATRLEASGRVDVLEALTVRESLVAYAGERTETAVRRLATELGADFVVVGSLTELAGHYSLDVRVTPVASNVATSTMVFTADDDGELLDRINELADRVLELVGTVSPRALVSEVHFDAIPELVDAARDAVRVRPGDQYQSAVVREDLARLRAMEGVASATVDTERRREGVTLTFRVVATEQIMPTAEIPPSLDRIAEVQVRGNRRIEANAIRARISTQPGDSFNQARVADDVREVYSLGFFRNVRVISEESIDGRVLIFEVEENPVVRQVSITGNENLDGEKIRDSLTLTTGSTLDYPLLYENRERIEALYRAEGYYLAKVRYEIEELPNEAVAIHFEVAENEKLRLQSIEFEGNEHFSDDELASGLHTKRWRWWSPVTHFLDRSGTYSEPVFIQDLQGVQEKYLNAGFLHVEVGEPEVKALEDGLVVQVDIVEGDRFNIGKVDVAGDETVDLEALRERLKLKEGETFNRSYLTDDVEELEHYYTNRGFYFASVNPRTLIDEEELRVDITFEVEKGPLYFIREIDVAGNTVTVDPVIRREMTLVEGQLYSARAIELSERRIRGLGFFEEVNFEPAADRLPGSARSRGEGGGEADGLAELRVRILFPGQLRGQRRSLPAQPVRAGLRGVGLRRHRRGERPLLHLLRRSLLPGIELQPGHDHLQHQRHVRGLPAGSERCRFQTRSLAGRGTPSARLRALQLRESQGRAGYRRQRGLADLPGAPSGRARPPVSSASPTGRTRATTSWPRPAGGSWAHPWRAPVWAVSRSSSASRGAGSVSSGPPAGFRAGSPSGTSRASSSAPASATPFPSTRSATTTCRYRCFNHPDPSSEVQALQDIDTDLTLPLTERYFLGGIGTYQLRGFKARSVGPRRAILRRHRILRHRRRASRRSDGPSATRRGNG